MDTEEDGKNQIGNLDHSSLNQNLREQAEIFPKNLVGASGMR